MLPGCFAHWFACVHWFFIVAFNDDGETGWGEKGIDGRLRWMWILLFEALGNIVNDVTLKSS